jgi:hypothetical protein
VSRLPTGTRWIGAIGCLVLAGAVFALTHLSEPRPQVLMLLGVTIVAGNTMVEMLFIGRLVWWYQDDDGPPAAASKLPFGENYQFGRIGLLMTVVAVITYAFADLPATIPAIPVILGIQGAAGVVMAGRGFLIKRVYFSNESHLDLELYVYLSINLVMCIITLLEIPPAFWPCYPSVVLQILWVALGYTHHCAPIKELFIDQSIT